MRSSSSRSLALLTSAFVAGSALLFASPASAATLSVCATGCDFTTIKAAVAAAQANDTIEVAAGTYDNEQGIVIDKPLTITGAGVGTTIVDGGGASAGTIPGIFRVLPGVVANGTGDIELSGMTLRNPGKNTTATQYFTISMGVKQATTGIDTIRLDDLDVRGTGDNAKTGYGLFADGGFDNPNDRDAPDLEITNSSYSEHVFNAIGIDAWRGDVTIEGNDLVEGIRGNSAVLVFNEYTPNRIANPVVIRDNNATGRLAVVRNIDVNPTLASRGGFDDVTIADNDVTGLTVDDYAALVSTNSTDGAEPTRIGDVNITGNQVLGDGVATTTAGFILGGRVENAVVDGNDIVGVGAAVDVNVVKDQNPEAVQVTRNRLFADERGVDNATSVAVDATENWWGCQTDPAEESDFCSEALNSGSGSIDADPWVVTTGTLEDTEVEVGEDLAVQVELDTLSDGEAVALPSVLEGLATQWSAERGTIDPDEGELGEDLTHETTYTAPEDEGADTIEVAVDRAEFEIPEATNPVPLAYGDALVTGEPIQVDLAVVAADVDPTDPDDGDDGDVGDGGASVGDGDDTANAGGALPDTGAPSVGPFVSAALALMLLGGYLLVASRGRRDTASA